MLLLCKGLYNAQAILSVEAASWPEKLTELRLKARPAWLVLRNPFYDSATLTWKTSNWLDIALASKNQGIATARDRLDELMPLCSLLGLFCLSGNACKGPKFTRNSA